MGKIDRCGPAADVAPLAQRPAQGGEAVGPEGDELMLIGQRDQPPCFPDHVGWRTAQAEHPATDIGQRDRCRMRVPQNVGERSASIPMLSD